MPQRRIQGLHGSDAPAGDGVATGAAPAMPTPGGFQDAGDSAGPSDAADPRETTDPDDAAANRAAAERERIEETLNLDGAGEDVTQRQLDALRLARIQEELHRTHARLRRVQRENDRLRANAWTGRQQADQDARRQLQPEIDRLKEQVERLKEQNRDLEQDKKLTEMERRFEDRFGSEESTIGREIFDLLSGLVSEHGGDYIQQVLTILKAQAGGSPGAQGGEGGSKAQNVAALKSALASVQPSQQQTSQQQTSQQQTSQQQTSQQQPAPQQSAPQHSPARPNPMPAPPSSDAPDDAAATPAKRHSSPASARDGSHVTAAPHAGQGDAEATEEENMTQRFARVMSEQAIEALENEMSAEAFAGAARRTIAQLEAEGYEHGAGAFVRLTERMVPQVAPIPIDAARVAELLAPFCTDLPGMARKTIANTPAPALKKVFIDPQGVDLQGHDAYLVEVLRELKSHL